MTSAIRHGRYAADAAMGFEYPWAAKSRRRPTLLPSSKGNDSAGDEADLIRR